MRFVALAVASIVVAVLHPSCARLVGRRHLDGVVSSSPGNPFVNVAPMPPEQDINECPQDPRPCPDGSLAEPDPDNDCEYPDCPVCCDTRKYINTCVFGPPQCCYDGSWTCLAGGKYVCGGVELTNPSGTICGESQEETVINQASCVVETKTCDDGSTIVDRDPDNDCEWFPCPPIEPCCDRSTQPDCGDDTPACCEGGIWAECPSVNDGVAMYKCAGVFDSDPSGVVCKEEETNCDESTKECPDGSILVPDPENECKLPACPCCDPVELPVCNGEGQAACCGNGEWSCPTIDEGEAFYKCSGSDELLRTPLTGIVCEVQDASQEPMPTLPDIPSETTVKQDRMSEAATTKCCDPNEEPNISDNPICKLGYQCCPDGTWACGVGDGRSFLCRNNLFYTGPFSEACPCCNISTKPACNNVMCCEDGTWSCPSNGVYTCSGEGTINPSGIECKIDGAPGEPEFPMTPVTPDPVSLTEFMAVVPTGADDTDESPRDVLASTTGIATTESTLVGGLESTTDAIDIPIETSIANESSGEVPAATAGYMTSPPAIVDESLGEVTLRTLPTSTADGTTAEPIINEIKPQGSSFEKRACRYGPSVGRDPNNNYEFLPCLTKAAVKQFRAQRKKERGGQNPKNKTEKQAKRIKQIKRRKKRAFHKQVREQRKRIRAERQQLKVNGFGTSIEVKPSGKGSKSSRTMRSKKG